MKPNASTNDRNFSSRRNAPPTCCQPGTSASRRAISSAGSRLRSWATGANSTAENDSFTRTNQRMGHQPAPAHRVEHAASLRGHYIDAGDVCRPVMSRRGRPKCRELHVDLAARRVGRVGRPMQHVMHEEIGYHNRLDSDRSTVALRPVDAHMAPRPCPHEEEAL